MRQKYLSTLIISILLLVLMTTVTSAAGDKINITYVAYAPSDAMEQASQTNQYSGFIDYTYINAYNASYYASDDLLAAAESGFLEKQDVILFDMVGSNVYKTKSDIIDNTLKAAHDSGTSLLSINGVSSTPSYFDYASDAKANDPLCYYYNNMSITGDGLKSAENLLIYLATGYGSLSEVTGGSGSSTSDNSSTGGSSIGSGDVKFLFILGTDINTAALNTAAAAPDISSQLGITVINKDQTLAQDFDFSEYSMIFIESQPQTTIGNWNASINAAKANGAMVIGYNLSSNITLPNVDLYSANYTDIERYWVQGGETNMGSMLKFMGQKFAGAFAGETLAQPEILRPKTNITYITNSQTNIYYLNNVLSERSIISDLFNVKVINGMSGKNVAANLSGLSHQDVILLYMIGYNELPEFKGILLSAKASGTQIGLVATSDVYGMATVNMEELPYSPIKPYIYRDGYTNMENFVRAIGAVFENSYIEYSPAVAPSIPDHGIYHPDAYPQVFANSTEYLEWYADHGYNASAPTIGLIMTNTIYKDRILLSTEDAIIRNLESKGYNVICATYKVATEDVDYFTKDDEVLVDSIISLKGFTLNYGNQEQGVEYLKKYNVPVLKGVEDASQSTDEFNESERGLGLIMVPSSVIQPEIDGCIDYIWVAGYVQDPETQQYYYAPHPDQVDWLCNRAISWTELGRTNNSDKKVTIMYWNHEGGKNDIGGSYLDIGSSFTIMLEQMRAEGYNVGNGTIPNSSQFMDLFITSRNVGAWAPGELQKVVDSGMVTLLPVDEYLDWYNTLPESVRKGVEDTWGKAPGDIMVYNNNFVIPTVQFGNVNFIPQPSKAVLSDESLIYHNSSIPPTHQYLATYFWINKVYDADAIIHFGTHGSQEWLAGKELGLSRYDYPALMVDDTPVIYPYIMDNVGEGTQAKRRGNAVLIDYLTPPIVAAGIYGDLATLDEKITNYRASASENDTGMMALYRNSTIQFYENLSLQNDLEVTPDELRSMSEAEFEDFIGNTVHEYLDQLQSTLMPYGVHTFGVAPEGEKLVCMVKSMLRSDFVEHIYTVLPKERGVEDDWADQAEACAMDLLNATLLNSTNVSTAQLDILGLTDDNITQDLNLGLEYADKLSQTTREINQTLRALDAEYIEPGPGNDPIRNPEALPTGRNFYSFDQRKFPDEETTAMGAILADQLAEDYYNSHNGTYPEKVSYTLWAMETMRHHGLMEAQIFSLLGVEPVRNNGVLTGFTVIPVEEMTHPRIDVLIQSSGMYRDTFPYQLALIDTAIRTVAELNETNETNYVKWNSLKMKNELLANGYNNSTADYLSKCRIFSEAVGDYGNGMSDAIAASDTWENETKLADLFISKTSYVYGQDLSGNGLWGDCYEDLLTMNLIDIDASIHSDSSNLFGIMDGDDYYGYLGGIGLTVRVLTGETPEMYIASLENVDNPEIISLKEALRTELRARYFNPQWITGMMEADYAGARQMMKTAEYMWGWDVTNPDLVTDSDWNEMYEIYVNDKYDLGLDEFLKTENPYQYQSITARMLETVRKDYWDASDEVVQNLVKEYVESVVEDGVTCCHHTCGNPSLDEYIQGVMSVPGVVDEETAAEYKKLMEEATTATETKSSSSHSSSSSNDKELEITNQATSSGLNQTTNSQAGAGSDLSKQAPETSKSTQENYVEGYEMTKETVSQPESNSSPTFSSSDLVAFVLVAGAAGAVFLGFMRKKKM
nr:cobaltochelatase subunit CobN [uncultured Methanomethylovorans sp.]